LKGGRTRDPPGMVLSRNRAERKLFMNFSSQGGEPNARIGNASCKKRGKGIGTNVAQAAPGPARPKNSTIPPKKSPY